MACFGRFPLFTVYSGVQIRIYDFSSNIQSCAVIAYVVKQAETIIFRSFYSAALVDYTPEIYSLGSHIVSEAELAHFHHAVVASSYQPTTGLLAQFNPRIERGWEFPQGNQNRRNASPPLSAAPPQEPSAA